MLEDDHDPSVAIDLPPDSAGRPRISIYQPETAGQIFPEIPEFANHAEERAYRQQHLVAACRAFAMHGFDFGFAGHLTVRDPERPELYWTNPMCVHFSQVKVSNLILADHKGNVVEGRHAINRAGFVLHGAVQFAVGVFEGTQVETEAVRKDGVRFQLEYMKAQEHLKAHRINSLIVVFGSARVQERRVGNRMSMAARRAGSRSAICHRPSASRSRKGWSGSIV